MIDDPIIMQEHLKEFSQEDLDRIFKFVSKTFKFKRSNFPLKLSLSPSGFEIYEYYTSDMYANWHHINTIEKKYKHSYKLAESEITKIIREKKLNSILSK